MDLDPNIVINHEEQGEALVNPERGYSNAMQNPMSSGSQKIDMWRNRNFDSGFQTMNHSEAPSIISSLHPSSHISGMSSVADYEQAPSLSDQQNIKFDTISYNGGPTGSGTDSQYGSAVRAIPELMNLMSDQDHAVVHKAIYIMQNIAKMDSDPMRRQKESVITDYRVIIALRNVLRDKKDHPNIIRLALGTLFHIGNRQEGLDLIFRAVSIEQDFIQHLVSHIMTIPFSCYKYALFTLHSILSDRTRGNICLQLSRQCEALRYVINWLEEEKSEKLLPVIVDLTRILCDKSNDQKALFINLGGSKKLLHIIFTYRYENLLWRSTQLLKTFSNFDANDLVQCGARDVLSKMLTHESPRLVISTLETLRNISDVPSPYNEDNLLKCLLMLLGSRNPMMMLYTVQILSNMVANNKRNKELMVCNQAVEMLLRSLVEASYVQGLSNKEAHHMEEFMESLICTLRQLCVGHSYCDRVQLMIFKEPLVFLDKLMRMRPILLKQTLNLLLKVASQNANLLAFRDVKAGTVGFAQQIIHVMKVACAQLQTQDVIEGIKLKDLVHLSIELLRAISRHHDIQEQIVFFLRTPENCKIGEIHTMLPIFVLQKSGIDENTKKSTLVLIYNLMFNEQMAAVLENNHVFMNMIAQLKNCMSPEISGLAENILRKIYDKRHSNFADIFLMDKKHDSYLRNESMDTSLNESFDGAGEQWSQMPGCDDPFVEMYCGSAMEADSKTFNSPIYNSPNPMYPPSTPQDYYMEQQPSSSSTNRVPERLYSNNYPHPMYNSPAEYNHKYPDYPHSNSQLKRF
ncbi:unnamed protein product [Caenorhabditis bovis]|uniref:Uncharacterized protein n=1 Tax=Caenorhabditis bovis TaxID=2654633 RepID=A0A8S1EBQ3_9PELO|nr:unnamed protein product [Caenorhabditis bovis]